MEQQFIQVVIAAQNGANEAEDDFALAEAKNSRSNSICEVLSSRDVSNWTGKVTQRGANGDGKGILEIEIAPDIKVSTWNNFLSDTFDNTLIEPSSDVFSAMGEISEGDVVTFSGEFISGDQESCIGEQSITLRSNLEDPTFTFRFSDLKPS